MFSITIAFKSYNHYYIKNSLLHLSKIIQRWNLAVINFKYIPLPNSRQKITLLKSPHVHKKSREQFSRIKRKGCLEINAATSQTAACICLILFYSQFPGTEVRCSVRHRSVLVLPKGKGA